MFLFYHGMSVGVMSLHIIEKSLCAIPTSPPKGKPKVVCVHITPAYEQGAILLKASFQILGFVGSVHREETMV